MTIQKMLAQNFDLTYQTAAMNLKGMTQEQSLKQPASGGNCANWILGHLTRMQNAVMQLAGEKPVWESEQIERAGFDPITNLAGAIDWNTLTEKFLGSRDRCLSAISALSDDALAEKLPHPFSGTTTRGELLNLLAHHQSYHTGQLGVLRRIAGLKGAVKGPGQASL